MNRRAIRKLTNVLALALSGLATAIGLFFLGAILWTLIRNGLAGVSLSLFTALNNQFWSSNLAAPMANLPVVIFQFALSPYPNWQQLAWSGALLITLSILILSISARVVVSSLNSGGRH